jgi:hypothetical protein
VPPGTGSVAVRVGEAQPLAVTAGQGQHAEQPGLDGGPAGRQRHRGRLQRGQPAAEAGGQDLLDRRGRAHRGLLGAADRAGGRQVQRDGDGHGGLVVQQQGRQVGARAEHVAAGRTGCGVHSVAELAQPLHVAAHRAGGDPEPGREVLTAPAAGRGQERQQPQHPDGLVGHGDMMADDADRT